LLKAVVSNMAQTTQVTENTSTYDIARSRRRRSCYNVQRGLDKCLARTYCIAHAGWPYLIQFPATGCGRSLVLPGR
jgi:hypothetical protein